MVIQQNRYILAAQQLNRLWSGALGARSGPVERVRADLDALARQVGVDLDLAHRLTLESLDLLVAPDTSADPLRAWLLAEMLFLSGTLAERDGDTAGAAESYGRALHVYRRLDPSRVPPEVEVPDPAARMDELRRRLGEGG